MLPIIFSIFLGVGLAASAGFRIFIPLLATSIAAHFGAIPLNESWMWVGSYPAMIMLGVACVFEIGAYYIPFLDNILDTIAVPLAAIAGTAIVAATVADLSPLMTWSLAIIAGGGTASAIKGANSTTRLASSTVTAGIGNPIISTIETFSSLAMGIISIFFPVLAIICLVIIFYLIYRIYSKFKPKIKENKGILDAPE